MFPTSSESEWINSQAADALLQSPRLGRWPGRSRPAARAGKGRRQPRVEGLEDRRLLSDTVITFDDLPAGTPVEHQYVVPPHDLGVDFQAGSLTNIGKTLPHIEEVSAGQAQSGTQVLHMTGSGDIEFLRASISGTFTKFLRQHVKVYVGYFAGDQTQNTRSSR